MTDGLNNLELQYNYLNLISEVGQNSATKATYRWSADGMKLGVREPGANGGDFEYLGSLIYKYVNGQLQLESGSFSNGRIVASHGSSTTYTPNYFITDHLGSTRVVWDGTNAERSDYYPFGGRWASAGTQATNNRFLYNGKELQTTGGVNYLDYGARMYDSRIGRWHSIDPLAEKYLSHSPFNYTLNNPIKFIDPDGRNPVAIGRAIFKGARYAWKNRESIKLAIHSLFGASATIAAYNYLDDPNYFEGWGVLRMDNVDGDGIVIDNAYRENPHGKATEQAQNAHNRRLRASMANVEESIKQNSGGGDPSGGDGPPNMNNKTKLGVKIVNGIALLGTAIYNIWGDALFSEDDSSQDQKIDKPKDPEKLENKEDKEDSTFKPYYFQFNYNFGR